MSDLSEPVVASARHWYSLGDDLADVEVSLDGGETWTTVAVPGARCVGRTRRSSRCDAAGESDVRVAFHMYQAEYDWWWEVDDVFLGNRVCSPTGEGGYVVGNVYAEEDGTGVVGATVTNLDVPEETALTTATPADENLDDGFYWLFSGTPGTHPFEASARGYSSVTQDVTVEDSAAVRADFSLGSGFIEVDTTRSRSTSRWARSVATG
ncbi:hypothetical protein BJF82_16600 [Kytococcus sp. CUA-901]|nr:hypothetical protein BJF82_16600 [Kytococcus sp. CUA-901]